MKWKVEMLDSDDNTSLKIHIRTQQATEVQEKDISEQRYGVGCAGILHAFTAEGPRFSPLGAGCAICPSSRPEYGCRRRESGS